MDPVQLLISFASITLLAVIAAKLYPAKDILTAASAVQDYQRYNPEAQIETAILGQDHLTAILLLNSPSNQLGIVTRLGDRLVCRTAHKGEIASFSVNGDHLSFDTNDFTQPKISIRLDPDELTRMQALIAGFTATTGGQNAV
jgi:hypothetical protein